MIEHTELIEDDTASAIDAHRAAASGQFISYAGSDIARGETLLRRGTEIGSREIGMLAACGFASVDVIRRPRVAVLSTGDELVEPGRPLHAGAVYDSNGAIIAAAVAEAGGEAVALGAVPDDEAALERAMRQALDSCDMVVLSGGTSKGAGDLSHRVVSRLGKPGILVHGVALRRLRVRRHAGKRVLMLTVANTGNVRFVPHVTVNKIRFAFMSHLLLREPKEPGAIVEPGERRVQGRSSPRRGRGLKLK